MSLQYRMEWVDSAEAFIGARKLRNLLVHEYMAEPQLFLEALQAAKPATEMLFGVITRIKDEVDKRGVLHGLTPCHADERTVQAGRHPI